MTPHISASTPREVEGLKWASFSFLFWNSKMRFCLKRESGMPDLIGGKDMKTRSTIVCLLVLGVLTFFGCNTAPGGPPTPAAAPSHELLPLQLIQRIPAPGVTGRIDHFTAYPKRRLLIFAALGNNTVEVVNN